MRTFILLFCFLSACAASAAVEMKCYNKNILNGALDLVLDSQEASLGSETAVCSADYVPYKPNSPKYAGWIKIKPAYDCGDVEHDLIKLDGNSEPSQIHFVTISKEVQNGQEGFVQLGLQNQWDPGSGGTVKSYLKCFPK